MTTHKAQELWLSALRAVRRSESTINHYRATFKALNETVAVEHIQDLTTNHLRTFLSESNASARTIRGYQIDLRRWFRFLVEEQYITHSPMDKVENVRVPKPVPDALNSDDWQKLMAQCQGKDLSSRRNLALICLLMDTGLRRAECAEVMLDDLDLKRGTVHVREGKGGKGRQSAISPKTVHAINQYLAIRQDNHPWLWHGKRGRLSYWGIGDILETLGQQAEVDVSSHKLRRTCALSMLKSGANIFAVQNHLGHEDIQVLQHYVKYLDQDAQDAHRTHSPVQNLT